MTDKKELLQLIIEGIQERKGHNITIVDMTHIDTTPTSNFVIAEGTSTTQVEAIAESVSEYVRKNSGVKPYNADGLGNSEWVVMDYGDIWVHIFMPETRRRYSLEELWSDAQIREIPDLD